MAIFFEWTFPELLTITSAPEDTWSQAEEERLDLRDRWPMSAASG